jgi:hypothetical protein
MAFRHCDRRQVLRREKQLAEYNANPNYCQSCGKKIEMGLDKLFAVRAKKYCDRSCASARQKESIRERLL